MDLSSIWSRRNPDLLKKLDIWKLIDLSYKGGDSYISSGNCFRYANESDEAFESRRKRSVYFNHVQPLTDMMAGFIYNQPIERQIPKNLSFMLENCSKGLSLDQFMQVVSVESFKYTTAILVDSPEFLEDEVRTEADRINRGLNPYLCLYSPFKIRDFYFDDDGELEWCLLDNSYYDNSNPFLPGRTVKTYRLWTKDRYIDFTEQEGTKDAIITKEKEHNLGEVPIIFANWRDIDLDHLSDSPMEDIALLDRQIYNKLSYLDENLAAATFKACFFPIRTAKDLPEAILKAGITGLSVIPYYPETGGTPFFASAKLEDVDPFIQAINLYTREIFRKVGLDKDSERDFWVSGVAKREGYRETDAILKLGSSSLERIEKEIFRLSAKWLGANNYDEVEIKYPSKFILEDIDQQLARLQELYLLDNKSIKEPIFKEIVSKALSYMSQEEKAKILDQIQITEPTETATNATANPILDDIRNNL